MNQEQPENLDRHSILYCAYHYGFAAASGDAKAEAEFKERFTGDSEEEAEYQHGFNARDVAWETLEREFPNATDAELLAVLHARTGAC